jgi:isopropylmalate/homocitrate/citramalate synthase
MMKNSKSLIAFMNNISNNNLAFLNIYEKLGCPRPFDVSLRDGLQGLSKLQQEAFTLDTKKQMFHKIIDNYNPSSIELGSIISNKILPIFKDSKELFQYANTITNANTNTKYFLLIPNKDKLSEVLLDTSIQCNHFSIITSVSNSFQKKNTKKTIDETKTEIETMIQMIDNTIKNNQKINYQIKLYISCINECPIEGKQDNNIIISEILKYKHLTNKINNICLSDTTGTLLPDDFVYIVDNCNQQGIPFSKFSLHLHVKNQDIVEEIFHKALDRNITQFDVSDIESGGCSVTMDATQLNPNLSYKLYYEFLIKYIMKQL